MRVLKTYLYQFKALIQFGDWIDNNPSHARSQLGLERRYMNAANAPEGSVLVWDPYQCGYHPVHGHIEIMSGPNLACSDFCGEIKSWADTGLCTGILI